MSTEKNCSTESQFLRLLDSNGPPRDSDTPQIRTAIRDLEREVGNPSNPVRTSISQHSAGDELGWVESLRKHRALLPPELLCDIFRHSLPDDYLAGSKDAIPPWTLGHVCRLWRMTAVGYSFLWSFIVIRAEFRSVDRAVAALECQLSRSNTTKLSIFLYCGYYAPEPELIAVLLPTSPRWKLLRFSEARGEDTLSWVAALEGNLRSLEALEFLNCGQAHRSGCAHRLRRLALLELAMSRDQMVELLGGLPALEVLALELTRSIPRVTLELLIIADSDPPNSTPILCPKLSSLRYGIYEDADDDLAYLVLIPAMARSRAEFLSSQSQKFTLYIYQWNSDDVLSTATTDSFRRLVDDGVELVYMAETDPRVVNERWGDF
ncbi:hypothetical protein C8F01DRAFT_1306298 [Mycena amicta]|nr:hypothetical protein C8F01DRAFT_1306298 [Mycena amicta]